ncbi:HAD family hydrolase [Coraliomargarita algicola]|uniref:phosphoglycolate phosphatase n=1 Tax=Coraliomargarita algicola TaxID=3092156 RepID=A0ABZ0RTK9_9BACT|nr:HAD family hydrolase [Coraliomargarita sp. J2-16]WPJ98197.1 HAD family hydrolase [Coraliomargarita sp. J2-16]
MDLLLEGSLKPIDLLVFDCDGVLLETMAAKIEAFRQWVPQAHIAWRDAFMEVVMAGFGKARTHHIRCFYEEILGETVSEAFLSEEVERFADICEPLCATAAWRIGSREFVLACRQAGIPRYVLSGTPQQPLEAMLSSTGAAGLFDVIIGSPPAKPESLTRILAETGVPAHRCVFVGDAEADRVAAEHVGAHFVYFPSEANRPTGPISTEVSDLRQLLDVITL